MVLRQVARAMNKLIGDHYGPNARDSKGRLFAVRYPDQFYASLSGAASELKPVYTFPDDPEDARGLFISSDNSIFVGLKGFKDGDFGRTYMSRDQGRTFSQVYDACFWGMDEDANGHLYMGVYHERNEPGPGCALAKSVDQGENWVNIALPDWAEQTHVHGLGINPTTNWLYANLGDEQGFDGCWRSKNTYTAITQNIPAGCAKVPVANCAPFSPGDLVLVHDSTDAEIRTVEAVDPPYLYLANPLARDILLSGNPYVFRMDWVHKFCNEEKTMQFNGIAFRSDVIFLSDNVAPSSKQGNHIVYKTQDDGTDAPVEPEPSLTNDMSDAWGTFFLRSDANKRIWTGVRPVEGTGYVWVNSGADIWLLVDAAPEESFETWRQTHTFRDFTQGQTGNANNQPLKGRPALAPFAKKTTKTYLR